MTEETHDEEDIVYLELTLDGIRNEENRSVIDIFDIPLFTEQFIMPVNALDIRIDDLFSEGQILRDRPEILEETSLFNEALIVNTHVDQIESEISPILFVTVGILLLGTILFILITNLKTKRIGGIT